MKFILDAEFHGRNLVLLGRAKSLFLFFSFFFLLLSVPTITDPAAALKSINSWDGLGLGVWTENSRCWPLALILIKSPAINSRFYRVVESFR